ncbi:unnamed protein product [Heterobilharzia americana]|nr:unnamed protein product [Heterobilharzia americana]
MGYKDLELHHVNKVVIGQIHLVHAVVNKLNKWLDRLNYFIYMKIKNSKNVNNVNNANEKNKFSTVEHRMDEIFLSFIDLPTGHVKLKNLNSWDLIFFTFEK